MKVGFLARALASSAAAVAVAMAGGVAPAQAATSEWFNVCGVLDCGYNVAGTITWHNRTASVTGDVIDAIKDDGTYGVAVFEAFAGSRKIDSETRSANADGSTGVVRGFNFTIGDTELVGGIDRIKITMCEEQAYHRDCGPSRNYLKD
jgi:hypothetical protein